MLANLTVPLVILATAAQATEWRDFGAYGSKQQTYSPAYHPRSSRYGAHSSPKSSGYGNHSTGYGYGYGQNHGYGQNPSYPTHEAYPEHSYNFNPRPVAHKPEYTHAPAQHHGSSSHAPKSSYRYGHPEPQVCVLPSHYDHAAPAYSHAAPSHQTYTPAAPTVVASAEYDGSWWTPNLQYSPPLIKYAVAAGIPAKGLFATCPLANLDPTAASAVDVSGELQFSQLPHQTVKVSASLTQLGAADVAGSELMFRILKTGDITIADAAGNCPAFADIEGEEFNNLEEVKGGLANPYADPTRGRIDTAIVPGLDTDNIVIDQNDLLQNLAGHDSIIGRAVVIVKEAAWDQATTPQVPDTVSGCCVIARSSDPADPLTAQSVWLRPQVVAVPGVYRYNTPVRTITPTVPEVPFCERPENEFDANCETY